MKKWKTLANPADASAWADVSNMWPTGRGSYETADVYASSDTAITATNEDSPGVCAWSFRGLTATRTYFVGKYIWELDTTLATATDRTGALGASAVTSGHACQYGDITIMARGTGGTLISSSGGNFAALAGSPSAKYVVVQSNCVVAFNTSANSDAWAASDVGDYTNWTTGEAASGRILSNNGPITGACAFGNDIIVFKTDSIFRMTYVGGVIKWQIQRIWEGNGLQENQIGGGGSYCCATPRGVFFAGNYSYSTGRIPYFLFDGTSPPRQVNVETDIQSTGVNAGYPVYDSRLNMVTVCAQQSASLNYGTFIYYYSLDDDAWGRAGELGSATTFNPLLVIRGDDAAIAALTGGSTPARPLLRGIIAGTNSIYKRVASAPTAAAGSCYVQTHKMSLPVPGEVFAANQARFGPAAPVLRRRSNYSSGSPALALTVDTYQELHDTTAAATASVTESTLRDRFDFVKSDTFCQLKLTATDTDIEIDDISVKIAPAGRV